MKNKIILTVVLLFSVMLNAQSIQTKKSKKATTMETAIFANGCFWCTEAIFQQLKGVEKVTSGYTGGTIKNPTYKEICTGTTGHAEAIQIVFDPLVISYQELLEVFFATHDPTTLNRQGYDKGTQYRSAIFYNSPLQKEIAIAFIKALTDAKVFNSPIVTEVTALDIFYKAEDYHQNYYNNNKTQGYCVAVINPKLDKFLKQYSAKIKK
ncbi:peptide-methionine (S)-S-oxide reductase [Lutibacter sp. HS1-25]|uniref:peptide-methionine (S)-S-oxide reductase MsrA n=1 Tax=Lutibacter sp. HS1-25 TaxID=2485000 RepID=UPI00101249D7|nr:peptide-methionine (S)-S-oxide reductase MsrA [Lutibacter sp. HS1-25]RXP44837.1 peptide-methionine (S)-S-oxide reductase [Lutibacter sp. HS1-25]